MYNMLVKDNKTLKQIAQYLNDSGARRKLSGKEFTINAVSQLIRNKRYIGYKYEDVDYIPAIVDEATFKRAIAILDTHRKRATFFKSATPFLLSGKTFCGYCRSTISADSGTSRNGTVYNYYTCFQHKKYNKPCPKTNIRRDFLEEKVVKVIHDYVLTDDFISQIADRVSQKFNEHITKNELLDDFKKLYAENERAINNMLSALEQGVVTNSTQSRLLSLEKRKDELLHNIAIQNAMQREPMTINEITNYLTSFKGLDYSLENNRKRLIHLFIRKVILHNNKCQVYFNYTDRAEALLSLDESLETEKAVHSDGFDSYITNEPKHSTVFKSVIVGARNRTRTGTGLLPRDFKSLASAIPPPGQGEYGHYSTFCKVSQVLNGDLEKNCSLIEKHYLIPT